MFTRSIHCCWLLLLLLTAIPARAQFQPDSSRQCPVRLAAATTLYESGRIIAALETLDGCDFFEDKARQQAYYRLLVLCYLELNQEAEATTAMKMLLQHFPQFTPSSAADPMRFIELYRTFKVTPRLVVAMEAGPAFTAVRVLKDYNLSGSFREGYVPALINAFNAAVDRAGLSSDQKMDPGFADYTTEFYNPMLRNNGLNIRGSVGVGLTPVFSLQLHNGLNFVTYKYASAAMQPAIKNQLDEQGNQTISSEEISPEEAVLDDMNPLYRYAFAQRLLYYQPSLALRAVWPAKRNVFVRPYAEVSGGGLLRLSVSRLFNTYVTPEASYSALASPPEAISIVRDPTVIRAFQPCFGGGAGVYLGRGMVKATIGITATKWVGNILNPQVSRYDHSFVSRFYHVDDDLTLTSVALTGGVIFNFSYQVNPIHHHEK